MDPRLKHSGVTAWVKSSEVLFDIPQFAAGVIHLLPRGRSTTRRHWVISCVRCDSETENATQSHPQTVRAKRRRYAFDRAIAKMAAESVMRAECAVITKEFRIAEADGLKQRLL